MGQRAGPGTGHLEGQPCLTHAPGPHERDEAAMVEQQCQVAKLDVAPDERRQRGGNGGPVLCPVRLGCTRHGRRIRRVQRPVLSEDGRLQLSQLGPGLEAEPFGEQSTSVLVDPERVGLAAGAVERDHQQSTRTFPQWVCGRKRLKLADCDLVTAEPQLDVEPLLSGR